MKSSPEGGQLWVNQIQERFFQGSGQYLAYNSVLGLLPEGEYINEI